MNECRLEITAVPGARTNAIEPLPDGRYRLRVTAPAVEGKANAAVCALVADALGLRPRAVTILRGETSRRKVLAIRGIDADGVARLLAATPPVTRPKPAD